MNGSRAPCQARRLVLHLVRLLLFVGVSALIHRQHVRLPARRVGEELSRVDIEKLREFFPNAATLVSEPSNDQRREVLAASGEVIGFVIETSPASDDLVGFSGPSNVLIAFTRDEKTVGVDLLSSGDTQEHVERVLEDETFLTSYRGLTWEEASSPSAGDVDGVSGAALTSLTIKRPIRSSSSSRKLANA